MAKPSIPQGTRDFSADTVRKRNYIFNTIRNVFELYGFEPLETPAMENLDTLMGKYGEEGDKLIFKILNNGISDPKNIDKSKAGFEKVLEGKSSSDLTERALKYDLTIPFARHVAMNHGRLTFPYRRYQIQPVWRADRPQKGRYREFTQCDADVVGSTALINEVELCNIYNEVFNRLGLWDYELKINSRKILTALATLCGGASKLTDITVAIDKLDKIGLDRVKEELKERELSEKQIAIIEKYLLINGSNEEKLAQITALIGHIETGKKGIEEIELIYQQSPNIKLHIDFTLARGLNYYTGIILEAKAPPEVKMGSIGGGGRYDDLTGLFDVPGIAGVGISFGVDRIYDVLEELQLFPEAVQSGTKAIFFNMGETESKFAFTIMQQLRAKNVSCEMYHEFAKVSKQFSYAEKKKIQYAVIIGSKEIEQKYCLVKDLSTGLQQVVLFDKLFTYFNK
ncbi:histidine--tRNA ligase [Ferruginibacter paludis]|uniref:histidine--tRNA ligase n=1 Tax=Ferruginibacter paludis TaxID=1310417 RepID=UPI0025B48F9B|nr:histidine--tRNA ligase [Ferruginibacter paludis]MDN3654538.1 histidine--tRNA ligase [Ferruginibacter paludis]